MEWKVPLIRPNPLWEVEPHTAVAARAQQKTSGQQLREDRIVTEQQRQHRLYKTKSKSSCKLQTLDDDGDAHWGSSTSVGSSAVTSAPFCVPFAQSCLTFCDPMDYSPPSSSVHGFLRQEDWIAISFFRGSPQPKDRLESLVWQADSLPLSHQRSLTHVVSMHNSGAFPFQFLLMFQWALCEVKQECMNRSTL